MDDVLPSPKFHCQEVGEIKEASENVTLLLQAPVVNVNTEVILGNTVTEVVNVLTQILPSKLF